LKEKVREDFDKSNNDYWGVCKDIYQVHPGNLNMHNNSVDLKFKPIPGYQGWNRSINSENIYGLTYENSRQKGAEFLKKINLERAEQLMKSSKFR